jgi:hypothetical protein
MGCLINQWNQTDNFTCFKMVLAIISLLTCCRHVYVSVDVGSIAVGMEKDSVILAPSKEDLSLRAYNVRTQMNRLRRASCNLFQSTAMTRVIEKLECEIETGRLAVRSDRMLHADLGESLLRQRL